MPRNSAYTVASRRAKELEKISLDELRAKTSRWLPVNKYLVTLCRDRTREQREAAARSLLQVPSDHIEFLAMILLLSDEGLNKIDRMSQNHIGLAQVQLQWSETEHRPAHDAAAVFYINIYLNKSGTIVTKVLR